MCGIRCCILDQRSDAINQVDWDLDEVHKIPQWLERRGPDEQQSILLPIISNEEETSNDHNPTSDQKWLLLQASVLCLRPTLIAQPVAISKSSIASRKGNRHTDDSEQDQDTPLAYFCWNGEIYPNELDIDSPKDRSTAHVSEQGESDTHWMAQKIQTLLLKDTESSDDDLTKHLADTLLSSHDLQHAEFAFVLVMPHRQSIFYGRDGLGRRSLVLQSTTTATADAASNGSTNHSSPENTARTTAAHISWQVSSVVDTDFASASDDCYQVKEVPPSTIFHCNYHTGQSNSYTWKAQPSQLQFTEMPSLTSLGFSSALLESSQEQHHYCRQLHHLLQNAVARRLVWNIATGERHSKCAVLFSGGLDSVVLAFFALKLCPNVELVNVSFVLKHHEGPQEHESKNTPNDPPINSPVIPMKPTLGKKVKQKKKATKKKDGSSESPTAAIAADTKAAYGSLEDLKRLFPDRKNLELIHRKVSWEEIEAVQKDRISQLLYPKRQEQKSQGKDQSNNNNQHAMDLNIATALWFAADTTSKDTRILLTGLGADEWLAGYGRHRQAYLKGGHQELRQELQKDQERLWERNLGRDDRTLSDFGKEVRYPYLDAHVTEYLGSHVPLEHICHFNDNSSGPESLPGDKRLLRLLAQDIGLVSASKAVKRAIQFGSRISHVVDKQRFGSRRKANKSMQKKKE